MTRQSRARLLAFATALLVVLLAAAFAWLRNLEPVAPPEAAAARYGNDAMTRAGRAAFVRLGCSGCHSAEGRGNPTLPLDGVYLRMNAEQLRAAAFARGDLAARVPTQVVNRKRAMASDPDAEAVIAYLQRIR